MRMPEQDERRVPEEPKDGSVVEALGGMTFPQPLVEWHGEGTYERFGLGSKWRGFVSVSNPQTADVETSARDVVRAELPLEKGRGVDVVVADDDAGLSSGEG